MWVEQTKRLGYRIWGTQVLDTGSNVNKPYRQEQMAMHRQRCVCGGEGVGQIE